MLLILFLTATSLCIVAAAVSPSYVWLVVSVVTILALLNVYQFTRLYRSFLPELYSRTLALSEHPKIKT